VQRIEPDLHVFAKRPRPFATRHRHRKTKWSWRAWFVVVVSAAEAQMSVAPTKERNGFHSDRPRMRSGPMARFRRMVPRVRATDGASPATIGTIRVGPVPANQRAAYLQHRGGRVAAGAAAPEAEEAGRQRCMAVGFSRCAAAHSPALARSGLVRF
jgi:hypothetical protein